MSEYTEIVDGVPNIEYGLTPITDETFIRQGWEKKIVGMDNDMYYSFEDEEDSDIFPDDVDDDEMPGMDDDMDTDSYYWVLRLPRENKDDPELCPILISTISDEILDGLERGQYVVQIYDFFELGICYSEEEIEILYRSLTGQDIYDF